MTQQQAQSKFFQDSWTDKIAPKSMWASPENIDKEKLLKDNQKIVYKAAMQYLGKGLSLQELIQVGNVGILKAISNFDPDRGVLFSTYAWYWILKAIQTAVEKETGALSIPTYVISLVRRYYAQKNMLADKLGRTPSLAEVARELYPPSEDPDRSKADRYCSEIKKMITVLSYLNSPDDVHLLPHPESTPEQQFIEKQDRQAILFLMKYLTQKERTVIILRFGMDGRDGRTYEEIGKSLGISKQGARKQVLAVIKKMKKLYETI